MQMRWTVGAKIAFCIACIVSLRTVQAQILGPETVAESVRRLEWPNGTLASTSVKEAVLAVGLLNGVRSPDRKLHGKVQERKGNRIGFTAVQSNVQYVLDQLSAAGPFLACYWDDSLNEDLRALAGTKWLLAANFRDNAELMPQFIKQVWLLAALLPADSLFVSIYESGSEDDQTGRWLEVLSTLLTLVDVQHSITTNGDIRRGDDENRIEFLAKVRNKVLEPLWGGGGGGGGGGDSVRRWPADRVIFSNDVYLCAKDFVRLMLHRTDVACALDYGDRSQDRLPGDDATEDQGQGERTFGSALSSQKRRRLLALHIYDKWVLRDGNGHMVDPYPPYASMHTPYTAARLKAGLPFPVTSCWNGLVVLPALPFTRLGLRFRSHVRGECRASECSLLSHDLHRWGFGRMIVDPGVQVAYEHWDASGMHIDSVVGPIARTTWEDVKAAPHIESRRFNQDSEICCNEDELDWMNEPLFNCHRRSFMTPNYTAIAFRERSTRAMHML